MGSLRNVFKVACAAAALGVVAAPAAHGAVTVAGSGRVAVRYDDLDLRNTSGLSALHARLAAAAERVCGVYDVRDLRARRAWRACYETALDDAVARVPSLKSTAARKSLLGTEGV
jgi:UrcA family protein